MSQSANMPPALRQAWALSYALRVRPTPKLATAYFNAIRKLLDTPPGKHSA